MIFSSAAEGTVLPGVAAEEAVSGDAPAVELEVVGPLDGLLAGNGALDGRAAAEEADELVLVVVVLAPLGALPEGLHPASNTVAAVRHANVDDRACDFLGICMTIAFGYVMAAFERGRPNSSQYCNPVAERFLARKLHTSANRNSVNGSSCGEQLEAKRPVTLVTMYHCDVPLLGNEVAARLVSGSLGLGGDPRETPSPRRPPVVGRMRSSRRPTC